jgi:hypothetical protein
MKKGYHKMPDGTMMKDSDHPKSGYKHGGMAKKAKGYMSGGMAKKTMGYAKGGMVNCGASMKPTQKSK